MISQLPVDICRSPSVVTISAAPGHRTMGNLSPAKDGLAVIHAAIAFAVLRTYATPGRAEGRPQRDAPSVNAGSTKVMVPGLSKQGMTTPSPWLFINLK